MTLIRKKLPNDINKDVKYVRDLKITDPHGFYVNPRKDQKMRKRYTVNMLLNYKIVSFLEKDKRYCFIRGKSSTKKRNYQFDLRVKNFL